MISHTTYVVEANGHNIISIFINTLYIQIYIYHVLPCQPFDVVRSMFLHIEPVKANVNAISFTVWDLSYPWPQFWLYSSPQLKLVLLCNWKHTQPLWPSGYDQIVLTLPYYIGYTYIMGIVPINYIIL